jgi:hypothetical protein
VEPHSTSYTTAAEYGQALAENDCQRAWIDPSATLLFYALTTVTTLEQQGYALMHI